MKRVRNFPKNILYPYRQLHCSFPELSPIKDEVKNNIPQVGCLPQNCVTHVYCNVPVWGKTLQLLYFFLVSINWRIASGCQESPTMLSITSTGTDLRSISLVAVAKLSLCQTMPSQFSPTDKLSIALRSISASRLQTPSQFWCTSQSHLVFAHLLNNGILV